MRKIWKLEDWINIDFFLCLDSHIQEEEVEIHRRDRQTYIRAIPQRELAVPAPAHLLKIWLDERIKVEQEKTNSTIPGNKITETYKFLQWILLSTGLLLGAVLAGSYFVYTGTTPLNVLEFFTLFLLPQLLFLLLLTPRRLLSSKSGTVRSSMLLLRLPFERLHRALTRNAQWNHKPALLEEIVYSQQATLHKWPLLLIGQLFGIGLNCGILLVTSLKIITTDLAFGWQTTLNLEPDVFFSMVSLLAAPWAWLIPPEYAHPSIEQIEGTRIVLKEGMHHLATANLRAWWSFLVMSLFCYGLLPRIILYTICFLTWRQKLKKLPEGEKYQRLLKRMTTPVMTSQAAPQKPGSPSTPPIQKEDRHDFGTKQNHNAIVLIPDEIYDLCSEDQLTRIFDHRYVIKERVRIFQEYQKDREILKTMADQTTTDNQLAVIIEAWMPPIAEHIDFLDKIMKTTAADGGMTLFFSGKPRAGNAFNPALEKDIDLWLNKLKPHQQRILVLNSQQTC